MTPYQLYSGKSFVSPIKHRSESGHKPFFTRNLGHKSKNHCFVRCVGSTLFATLCLMMTAPMATGNHQGHQAHSVEENTETTGTGHPIPGAPFQVFLKKGKGADIDKALADAATKTVVDAFTHMVQQRTQYHRFDEAMTKGSLKQIIIEPKVVNREGKEFLFLVARTQQKGQVKLLISASALKEKGYLSQPEKLVPDLAREFQWVVIKASTTPKRKKVFVERDLKNAPIKTNKEIKNMSGDEREQALLALFETYLTTVDDYKSLKSQPYYEVGTTTLIPSINSDTTTKLYDIRIREALQAIVRNPYFVERAPKAIRSLLNGKIWNVSFTKIDERDWATRTRVLPKDKSVTVGHKSTLVQPAKILVNYHRKAAPDDPFYSLAEGLPMGALSADKLARVIAWEIQKNITDKSMRGHVAEDEKSAPQ